jgi:hypothetical protein
MSPDQFDDLDRALSSGLSALAPDVTGGDEALAALRPRFQRARRRARVAKIGATVVAVVAIGSVLTLAAPSSARSHVNITGPGSTPSQTTSPTRSTTTTPTTVRPVIGRGTTSSDTRPLAGPGSQPGLAPTSVVTVPGTTPGTDGHGGGPGPTGGGDHHGHDGSSTTTTFPANDVHSYDSRGGAVTVRYGDGALTLVSVVPAAGYTSEVSNQPDDLDVRFHGGQGDWRIRVQVDGDGHLTSEITPA